MNIQNLLAAHDDQIIRVGLIGAGDFGASLIGQAQAIRQIDLAAVCDKDMARAETALKQSGIAEADIARCESIGDGKRALAAGRRIVTDEIGLLSALPLDVLVEATGDPEAGAESAELAVIHGINLVMATKEADCVIGPLLHRLALDHGSVHTPVDGDQPSLLIGLIGWARTLGLDVVCAGKASEYDFVYDPTTGTVTSAGRTVRADDFDALWQLPADDVPGGARRRADMLTRLPQRTVPDLCEMTIVANATGLKPDTPVFHAPVARTVELPNLFRPTEAGGLLAGAGRLDIFNCLRRPDELSFAGGVFVIVACRDRKTWRLLADKGVPVSDDGGYALLHNPVHLLGLEAPISILSACLLGQSTGGRDPRPVCDLVAHATRPLIAGETFALAERHTIDGLDGRLTDAAPATAGNPLPYYMAVGACLRTDVPADTTLTVDMVDPPPGSVLWRLRADQDRLFWE